MGVKRARSEQAVPVSAVFWSVFFFSFQASYQVALKKKERKSVLRSFAATASNPRMTPCNKFWIVSGDPTFNFKKEFLIWNNRPVFSLLEERIKQGICNGYTMFVVPGTEGTGKSFFSLSFVLKQLQEKPEKRLLFKQGEFVYVINALKGLARGPYSLSSPKIHNLLCDPDAWLVIDGTQEDQYITCLCKVLLVCSTKKESHRQLGKGQVFYMPAWSEEDLEQFMADYEPYRNTYQAGSGCGCGDMSVPTLAEVQAQFKLIGGHVKYILQQSKLAEGRTRLENAIHAAAKDLKVLGDVMLGSYIQGISDFLVHLVAAADPTEAQLDLASGYVWVELQKAYRNTEAMQQMIEVFLNNVRSSSAGGLWGKLYELMVHQRLSEGGEFKFKKLDRLGEVVDEGCFVLAPHQWEVFDKVEDLKGMLPAGHYCTPTRKTCVDGVFERSDDKSVVLVQAFSCRKGGIRGYEVEAIHECLHAQHYELWACVPTKLFENKDQRQRSVDIHGEAYAMDKLLVQVDFCCQGKKRR